MIQDIFFATSNSTWERLPIIANSVKLSTDSETPPTATNLSFTATASGTMPIRMLFPRTRLPRKIKKAVKTLYFPHQRHFFNVRINPTPRTKAQRKIASMCAWDEIITPKGEKLKFVIR